MTSNSSGDAMQSSSSSMSSSTTGSSSSSSSGCECPPHNANLYAGDACFEWAGLVPGWVVVSNDCRSGYIPSEPQNPGKYGQKIRTECILDPGRSSSSAVSSSSTVPSPTSSSSAGT
ncbi:MAG: hypothetical protein JWP89_839 [Schlesneria sp.]|nr:hypothetical protein [Schlesneria sp.]